MNDKCSTKPNNQLFGCQKLSTIVASATFFFAPIVAFDANADGRLPPCPKDRSVSWDNCHGTLTFPNGEKYVGEFKDGKRNGQGTLTWPDGGKYVGEIKDRKANGQGTLTFANGDKYVGQFKDGKENGQGTYTCPNGDKYVGEFKDGLSVGQGIGTYADGGKYSGEFRNNKFEGQGTYTWPNGDKYFGEFKDGLRNGQGTYTPSYGVVYVGEFRNGLPNGQGARYAAEGSIGLSGMWADRKFMGTLVPMEKEGGVALAPKFYPVVSSLLAYGLLSWTGLAAGASAEPLA